MEDSAVDAVQAFGKSGAISLGEHTFDAGRCQHTSFRMQSIEPCLIPDSENKLVKQSFQDVRVAQFPCSAKLNSHRFIRGVLLVFMDAFE